MNVYIFVLYIFLRNSRFLNIRENMYTMKITFIITYSIIYSENANFKPRGNAHFRKSAKKLYARKYLRSQYCILPRIGINPGNLNRGNSIVSLVKTLKIHIMIDVYSLSCFLSSISRIHLKILTWSVFIWIMFVNRHYSH